MILVMIIKYSAFDVNDDKGMYCIDLNSCLLLFGKKWRQYKIVRSEIQETWRSQYSPIRDFCRKSWIGVFLLFLICH